MIYGPWTPSVELRFVERKVDHGWPVNVLQQRWTRSTTEYTEVAGRPYKHEGFEERWQDVPLEKER